MVPSSATCCSTFVKLLRRCRDDDGEGVVGGEGHARRGHHLGRRRASHPPRFSSLLIDTWHRIPQSASIFALERFSTQELQQK